MNKTHKCQHHGCDKSFAEPSRLRRHLVTHNPSEWFKCHEAGCSATFSRKDARDRHMKKHGFNTMKLEDQGSVKALVCVESAMTPVCTVPSDESSGSDDMSILYGVDAVPTTGYTEATSTSSAQRSNKLVTSRDSARPFEPLDLLQWFRRAPPFSISSENLILSKLLSTFPKFVQNLAVNYQVRERMILILPFLESCDDFTLTHISLYLEMYWCKFHPQYPILHKLSFDYSTANSILLVSMVVIGAYMAGSYVISLRIAEQLRWVIFRSHNCKHPAPLFILQSLLLLEIYEFNGQSKDLHTRAAFYSGFQSKVFSSVRLDMMQDETKDPWTLWVEFESLKRVCLVAAHTSVVNSIHFGESRASSQFVHLSVPCDERLWEHGTSSSVIPSVSIFDCLRKILQGYPVSTNHCNSNILLSALLSISFSIKAPELEMLGYSTGAKTRWLETLSLALEKWEPSTFWQSRSPSSMVKISRNSKSPFSTPGLDNKQQNYDIYHLGQIHLMSCIPEIMKYCGSPDVANSDIDEQELKLLEAKVEQWRNSPSGRISMLHALTFLSTVLLGRSFGETYLYDPQSDSLIHRKYSVATALFVVFAYTYSVGGPESNVFSEMNNSTFYPEREDGYLYLRRVTGELCMEVGNQTREISSHKVAERLKRVDGINHIVGLLKIFYITYESSACDLDLRFASIMRNCIERCLGRGEGDFDARQVSFNNI